MAREHVLDFMGGKQGRGKGDLSVEVTGYEEVRKTLLKLGPAVAKTVVGKALKFSATPLRKAIRTNLQAAGSVVTGELVDSIVTKLVKQRGTNTRLLVAGAKDKLSVIKGKRVNPAKYAHLVEFGTQPHVIRSSKGWFLAFGNTIVEEVSHPGATKGKGAVRRAFNTKKGEVKKRYETKLFRELDRETAKAKAAAGGK